MILKSLAILSVLVTAPAWAAETPDWMTIDAAKKSVSLDMVAGWNPNNGALNYNGYSGGEMTVVVPVGWTVKIAFTNHCIAVYRGPTERGTGFQRYV